MSPTEERPTLCLNGESFFFGGPCRSYLKWDTGIGEFHQLGYNHQADGVLYSEYVVLGVDRNYFRCSITENGEYIDVDSVLDKYGGITEFLATNDVEHPAFLSLGPNGYWYCRTQDGTEQSVLPPNARATLFPEVLIDVTESRPTNRIVSDPRTDTARPAPLESLWFGVGGTYLAQRTDGTKIIHFGGNKYERLRVAVEEKDRENERGLRIWALALNLAEGTTFACLWEDGSMLFEQGRWPNCFDGSVLMKWHRLNFPEHQH